MDLLSELRSDKRFYGECPSCNEEFPLYRANLFSAQDGFPANALKKIAEMRQALKEAREELRERRRRITKGTEVRVKGILQGKILEMIVPSFDDFGYPTRDCRSLLQPIDYIVFSGLTKNRVVDAITFLEVKSGKSKLDPKQREIARAIPHRVKFEIIQSRISP